MAGLTIQLSSAKMSAQFNLRRWEEVLADPTLRKIEGRIETDRHGRINFIPLASPHHGRAQANVSYLLNSFLPHGETLIACPISTADGVRAADIAWVSKVGWTGPLDLPCFVQAPEICIEIISPNDSKEETRERTALYCDAGAKEVWLCDTLGKMKFFGIRSTPLQRSKLCSEFPNQI